MHSLAFFTLLLAVAHAQEYALQSSFFGDYFFDNFEFYTSWDPTFGYVHYVDQATALQYQMVNTTNSSVSFGVDTGQILDPSANLGRLSLRLVSTQSWTHGLFILDLAHMPDNQCGVWPSFWTVGSGVWPSTGEIDIIEFANNVPNNLMALHTTPGCTVAGADESGTLLTSDCGAGNGETGCTVSANTPNNEGSAFNAKGGGVYAMEWTSAYIKIWFFPRNAIPDTVSSTGVPDVNTFGMPIAFFAGDCDVDTYFSNHSLVFDTDFCGQWAGNTWQVDGCPMLDVTNGWQSCNDFVALNPHAFVDDTYWEVNYLNIYQTTPGSAPASSTSLTSATPAMSTSSVNTALSGAEGRSSTPTVSLAGTLPTITTGSFTATSSVLSALSSFSTASAASASSMSAGLVSRTAGTSSYSSSTSIASTSVFLTSSSTSVPPPAPTLSPMTPLPLPTCTDEVCVVGTDVSVVQTITSEVIVTQAKAIWQHSTETFTQESERAAYAEPRERYLNHRQVEETVPIITSHPPRPTHIEHRREDSGGEYGRCDFMIPAHIQQERAWTDFVCTFTHRILLEDTFEIVTLTTSTSILSSMPLDFQSTLTVDRFAMETRDTSDLTSLDDYTYTGSFHLSHPSVQVATVTAYPVTTTSAISSSSVRTPSCFAHSLRRQGNRHITVWRIVEA